MASVLLFCPRGERYHLDGGCNTTRSAGSAIALPPCARCVVGHCDDINQVNVPQVFWANVQRFGHNCYHIDSRCVPQISLQSKTFCSHCLANRKFKMHGLRLMIQAPYRMQRVRLLQARGAQVHTHSTPDAEIDALEREFAAEDAANGIGGT